MNPRDGPPPMSRRPTALGSASNQMPSSGPAVRYSAAGAGYVLIAPVAGSSAISAVTKPSANPFRPTIQSRLSGPATIVWQSGDARLESMVIVVRLPVASIFSMLHAPIVLNSA